MPIEISSAVMGGEPITQMVIICSGLMAAFFTYGGPGNTHRAAFDQAHLTACLRDAGFNDISLGAVIRGHNHGKINLGMTAIK